jgi:hypothetical protein
MRHAGLFLRLTAIMLLLIDSHGGKAQIDSHGGKARQAFHGAVTDAATGLPVEMAAVRLLKGKSEAVVRYTFTDAKGAFTLPAVRASDSLQIAVSLLGYKEWKETVLPGGQLHIRLEEQPFRLREVAVRPGRVRGQRDTVRYDVAQFLTSRDETVKDVIRKLPGIDVDDLGVISFNGKSIRNFYVEGLDLTAGRYSQITDNLDAKAVESIELLENHQPVRILQDKVRTDDIALNLKLKPDFRSRWILAFRGGAGVSPFLWEASASAMQLSRKSQSGYIYKGDNTGKDVTEEQVRFFDSRQGKLPEQEAPSFLSQPSILAPLKKERLLFNDVHSLAVNRLYRLGETALLRINAGYAHDTRRQERESETVYFRPGDSLCVAEQTAGRISSRQAEVSLNLENNTPDYFTDNRFKVAGNWGRSLFLATGSHPVNQQIKTDNTELRNDFRQLWSPAGYTLEARSLIRYTHSPSRLIVDGGRERYLLNHLYTDHSFTLIRKRGRLSRQYGAGVTGQASNLKSGFSLYALPSWQWSRLKWYAALALPVVWTNYPGGGLSRVAASPSASFDCKLNYAWRFSLHAGYREQYGDILNFRAAPYHTDYRHTVWNDGELPVLRLQNYSAYGEYKKTVREFFAFLSVAHTRSRSDRIYGQLIEGNRLTLASRHLSGKGDNWLLRGAISKGFYELGIKTSLGYQFSRSRGEQLSQSQTEPLSRGEPLSWGERLPFVAASMQYEPKISWSPSRYIEASYQSVIRYGGSVIGRNTRLAPLWNIVQEATVSYELFPFELNLSASYYHNDVNSDLSAAAFFADISFRLKLGGWQFEAFATNLFDKRQYRYAEYASLQSYTSRINIRGRELLMAAKYKF